MSCLDKSVRVYPQHQDQQPPLVYSPGWSSIKKQTEQWQRSKASRLHVQGKQRSKQSRLDVHGNPRKDTGSGR